MAGNDAIHANPTDAVEHLTTHGSDWLWAVFAVMLFSDLVVFVWHLTIPRGQRIFHQLGLFILTTASIAYFLMASDLGYANILTEFAHTEGGIYEPFDVTRQVYYTRYIDWVVTTPALLLELVLASGLPLADIMTLVYFDLVMIITGLVGALIKSSYKFGLFTFGNFALFYIWWVLAGPARQSAGMLGAGFKRSFTTSAIILSTLWLLYPIAWGLCEGGNVLSVDSEMVFYGVLDVLAKPVFCFIHLFSLSKLDLSVLQLQSGKASVSAIESGNGAYGNEKLGAAAGNSTTGGRFTSNSARTTDHDRAARDAVIGAGIGGAAAHHHHTTTAAAAPASAVGTAEGDKKRGGMFSRKGKYDAPSVRSNSTAPRATSPMVGTTGAEQPITGIDANVPRTSEATVVSNA